MIDKKEIKNVELSIKKHKNEVFGSSSSFFVGFLASAFDLLHAGHMLMLNEATCFCDHLVVALHKDPSAERPTKNSPIMTLEERLILLEGNKYVDDIIVYETEEDLLTLLKEINPDIRFLGKDWKNKDYTGKDLPITIHWIDRSHGYSTSELRKRVYLAENANNAKRLGAKK